MQADNIWEIWKVEQPHAWDIFMNQPQVGREGSAKDLYPFASIPCGIAVTHQDMKDMVIKCSGVTKIQGSQYAQQQYMNLDLELLNSESK